MVATQQFMTLPELRRAAQRKLPLAVWDYVCGGAVAPPVMTAPIGAMYLLGPAGDVAMARAAGRMGTIHWLSSMTAEPPEEVAAATSGPLVFQLYFRGDNSW